jgi:hypothetical protein
MSKAAELAALIGSQSALSNRNVLINGEWQVSQRGDYTSATSLPTSATYYLDRFKFRRGGVTGTFTHKLDQTLDNNDVVSTVRLDVTSTATGNVHCLQIFEDVDFFKNKTITFSARVKSNSTNARLIINADGGGGTTSSSTHTGGSGWELLKGTATITSGATGVQLYCGIQAAATGNVAGVTNGDFFEISQIQVEVGEQATPFEHRSFGDELARCQRYYWQLSTGVHGNYPSWAATGYNTNQCNINLPFPVPMRTVPTASFNTGNVNYYRFYRGGSNENFGNVATDTITSEHLNMYGDGISHTQGLNGTLQIRLADGAGVFVTAEL